MQTTPHLLCANGKGRNRGQQGRAYPSGISLISKCAAKETPDRLCAVVEELC